MKVWTTRVIAAGAIAGSITANAYAADLPPAPVYRAPETPVVQVYNWTGIYLGVNGGYGIGESTPMSLYSDNFSAFDFSANGGLVGQRRDGPSYDTLMCSIRRATAQAVS